MERRKKYLGDWLIYSILMFAILSTLLTIGFIEVIHIISLSIALGFIAGICNGVRRDLLAKNTTDNGNTTVINHVDNFTAH